MKSLIGSFIGLMLSVSVGAESLLEGRVRLSSGQPAADVQVRLFDMTDLRRSVGTTTDETGHFALPLRAFSTAKSAALPTDFALGQNYPNPFNPSTLIPYQLLTAGHVRLEVFNLLGQRLATLVEGMRAAGAHTAQWDATDAAGRAVGAGVYIYRLSSGGQTATRRMVLVDGQAGIPAAQGAVRAAVQDLVEADGSVYGLTVSGEGLVAYVNPAFREGVDESNIVLEEHGGLPRMKLVAGGLLGDVNNDGQVDISDVLYVLLYVMADSPIILPNNGDISLGDINNDGTVDLADVLLLVQYIDNPSDPTLPLIGDDHGDTSSEATEVSLGRSTFGSISEGDVDWFVVEMNSAGILSASMTSSAGAYIFILDSAGNILARDGNSDAGFNFQILVSVSSGTYYILVEAYRSTTDYTLDVQSLSGASNISTNLTQNASDDWTPVWSPDGQRIAFASNRDGNTEVHVMDADGTNPTNLTQNDDTDGWNLVWSPDGQRIAFTSERDGNTEVYVMDADGTNPTNLTRSTGDDWAPVWSSEGHIAFASNRDDNTEVYVMATDGTNPTNLTQNARDDWAPVWSPDSQRIAFASNRDDNTEVYVMATDGTNPTNLTQNAGDDRDPVWSPDGQHIAFASNRDGNTEVYVMDADGTEQTRLTYHFSGDWAPVWSPDGQRIAFLSNRDGNTEVYVMDADGTEQTNLTQNAGDDWAPVWSSDGQRIAFASNRDGNTEVYVVDVD